MSRKYNKFETLQWKINQVHPFNKMPPQQFVGGLSRTSSRNPSPLIPTRDVLLYAVLLILTSVFVGLVVRYLRQTYPK